jgi:putative tricarboxylic transport membrane protein
VEARARLKNSVVAAVFVLTGVWICIEALQVPVGSLRMPGAGFFPLVLGVALGVLAVMLFALGWTSREVDAARIWPDTPDVLYVTGILILSAWLFERAGFLISMAVFLAVSIKVLGRGRWLTVLATAVIGSVTSYWVFVRLLQISLPSGVLGF